MHRVHRKHGQAFVVYSSQLVLGVERLIHHFLLVMIRSEDVSCHPDGVC
jgi:hypothetical protein